MTRSVYVGAVPVLPEVDPAPLLPDEPELELDESEPVLPAPDDPLDESEPDPDDPAEEPVDEPDEPLADEPVVATAQL
jgi:hypothetical protein